MGCGCAGSTTRLASAQARAEQQAAGAKAPVSPVIDEGYYWNGPKSKKRPQPEPAKQ